MSSGVDLDSSRSHFGNSHPVQQHLTESLVKKVVIGCNLPISIVDNPHFREFLRELQPKFVVPCRQTVTNTLLPKIEQEVRDKLKVRLKNAHHLAVTTDIWSDRRTHAYLGMTVHTFADGELQSHLLDFHTFRGSHTGQSIADQIETILIENSIHQKVVGIVTDNATNMRKAISLVFPSDSKDADSSSDDEMVDNPDLWQNLDLTIADSEDTGTNVKRVPCFAHSLQLVVRDGLKNMGTAKQAAAKTCKLASLVHHSPLFKSSFEKVFGNNRSLPAAVETRWNSTFRQIQSVVDLDQAKLNELLRESTQQSLVLTQKDLSQLRELIDILGPFCEATDLTQGDKSVTISCVVPIVLSLRRMLSEKSKKPSLFPTMVTTLLKSLNDRFHGLLVNLELISANAAPSKRDLAFDDELYLCAAAMDPKFAFNWIQDIEEAQGKEALQLKITGLVYK